MERPVINKSLLFTAFLFLLNVSFSQDILDKRISIKLENKDIFESLQEISELPGISLSFSRDILPQNTTVNFTFDDVSLKKVLKSILGSDYKLTSIGNHTIIQKKVDQKSIPRLTEENELESDSIGTLHSPVALQLDTLIASGNEIDSILIQPEIDKPIVLSDSIYSKQDSLDIEKPIAMESDSLSIPPLSKKIWQASLIRSLSTAGKYSKHTEVNYSFNLISGHLYKVNGIELGFLGINKLESELYGAQIAGLGNLVGESARGVQMSFLFNHNKGKLSGTQLSGLFNYTKDSVKGLQVSGVTNISGSKTQGVQLAMGTNVSVGETHGAQLAMASNLSGGPLKGAQISGITNVAKANKGVQIAGVMNISRDSVKGIQLAPINYAKRIKGIQIGFINIADSAYNSISIGLLNFIKTGKNDLSLEYNDVEATRLVLRTGNHSFYSMYSFGLGRKGSLDLEDEFLWTYGFGMGHESKIGKKFSISPEISSSMIQTSERTSLKLNLLNRLNLNLGYRFSKNVAIYGGPSLNVFITELYDPERLQFDDLPGQSGFYERENNELLLKAWFGYSLGISLF